MARTGMHAFEDDLEDEDDELSPFADEEAEAAHATTSAPAPMEMAAALPTSAASRERVPAMAARAPMERVPALLPKRSGMDTGSAIALFADALASGLSQHRTGRKFDAGFWTGMQDRRDQRGREQAAAADQAAKKATAAEAADPASPASQRARAAMGPLLKQLGLKDEELAGLSAADVQAMGQGNLAIRLADVRRRAADNTAKAQAADARFKQSQGEFDRRNAITAPQRRGDAIAASGLAADRAEQSALRTDELLKRRQIEQEERDAKRKGAERLATSTKEYGQALQKSDIPTADATLARVEQLATKLREKNGEKLLGGGDEIKRRLADVVNDPQWYATLSDPDAQELMREVQALRNVQIKDQAGAAVANSEFGRQQAAMGSSALNSTADILRWTHGMRRGLDADRKNLLGGFGPDVVQSYERNLRGAPDDDEESTYDAGNPLGGL